MFCENVVYILYITHKKFSLTIMRKNNCAHNSHVDKLTKVIIALKKALDKSNKTLPLNSNKVSLQINLERNSQTPYISFFSGCKF